MIKDLLIINDSGLLLTNAICPWALFAASIVNKITGKELRFEASELNEIGAIIRLNIVDKPSLSQ